MLGGKNIQGHSPGVKIQTAPLLGNKWGRFAEEKNREATLENVLQKEDSEEKLYRKFSQISDGRTLRSLRRFCMSKISAHRSPVLEYKHMRLFLIVYSKNTVNSPIRAHFQ